MAASLPSQSKQYSLKVSLYDQFDLLRNDINSGALSADLENVSLKCREMKATIDRTISSTSVEVEIDHSLKRFSFDVDELMSGSLEAMNKCKVEFANLNVLFSDFAVQKRIRILSSPTPSPTSFSKSAFFD